MVIIDEEHANNTSKANDIINAFSAKNIIRVNQTVHHRYKSLLPGLANMPPYTPLLILVHLYSNILQIIVTLL